MVEPSVHGAFLPKVTDIEDIVPCTSTHGEPVGRERNSIIAELKLPSERYILTLEWSLSDDTSIPKLLPPPPPQESPEAECLDLSQEALGPSSYSTDSKQLIASWIELT